MAALQLLFSTDIGLLSLFTIAFIICMGIFLYVFVRNRIRDEEQQASQAKLAR